MLRDVVAVVDGHVHPFELGVACEVFGIDRSDDGLPCFDFAVCATGRTPLPGPGGMSLNASYGLDRAANADLVVIPAWHTRDEAPPGPVVDLLRATVARGAWLLSVCSGAFLLAAAGLLDDRRATCHWHDAGLLASRFPHLALEPDRLYVEDGLIVTSAGTAAGIDACLHIVRRELGARVANGIARRMVVPPHRDGGQAQYVETPVPRRPADDTDLAPLLAEIQANLHRPFTIAGLAASAHISPRTVARHFVAATGSTPHQWLTRQRVLLAQQLLEEDDLTIDEIARRTGFGTANLLRHHFQQQVATTPTGYRRTFSHQDRTAP
ncbi:MAG: AraC family transcriptional regulator [Pseudonocardiales bacterium]|nr:MAG: AraC family transcriptional regulator [Pseudonocardiales bacterium]